MLFLFVGYIVGKTSLDIPERIVNDLVTGLRRLPSWFPVDTQFGLLSNFHANEHIFKRFTVDPSLGTYVDSANCNYCQVIYLMFHEAY